MVALILIIPLFFFNKKQQDNEVTENHLLIENLVASQNNESSATNVNQNDNPNADTTTAIATKAEESKSKIEGNINDPEELYKGTALIYVGKMKKYNLAVTKDTVVVLDNENIKYSLPDESGTIKYITTMDDLNLVFLLTDKNKLFSFSPISKKFESQTLKVDIKKIKAIDAYMTYLYVVTDSGIKRYARKEGGFDDGEDWLKEEYKTNDIDKISINENIYLLAANKVKILFSGKKKDFKLENDKPVDLIYAKSDKYLWAINKEKATIYKFNRFSGKLADEFVHDDIKNVASFTIDESKNSAIITTSKKVLNFKLKKK